MFAAAAYGKPTAEETAEPVSHQRWSIGAGMVLKQSEYRGVSHDLIAFPAIGYRGERFSLQGVRGVAHFRPHRFATIDLFVQPRFSRYRASDSSFLEGMQRRKMTAEGGMQLQTRLPGMIIPSAGLSIDALRVHKGYSSSFSLARPIPTEFIFLTPFVGLEYLDGNFANYYYGVRDAEERANRPAYQPGGMVNFSVGCRIARRLGNRFSLMSSLTFTRLGGEAYRSPVVSSRTTAAAFAALTTHL